MKTLMRAAEPLSPDLTFASDLFSHQISSCVSRGAASPFEGELDENLTENTSRVCSSMPLKDQSNSTAMKPAVDEMFPEGAGPYVDLDEVC